MPKVYVVNNSGHDFTPAERFGDIVFLSEGRMNRFKINSMYRQFVERMEDSSSEDYILVTGLIQMNVIAASIQAHKHGRVNLLIYSDKNQDYEPREIVLGNLINKEEG